MCFSEKIRKKKKKKKNLDTFLKTTRTAMSENVPSDVRPARIQISLRIRAGWSESSLGAF